MNYMNFDPYPIIKERNERTRREVQAMHLGARLREARRSSATQLVALARRGVMPLLRAARLAG